MSSLTRTLAGLILFGISFGFVEASVVVYIRHIYEPLQHELLPGRPINDIFPVVPPGILYARQPDAFHLALVEMARETATIAMLAAVALLVAPARGAWPAAFAVTFGTWDISFYAFLKLLIGWPASLATWDLLFLVPVPWTSPVWAPLVVAISMIAGGILTLARPLALRGRDWGGLLLAAALIVAAFLWDFRQTLAGELPVRFQWPLYWTGELLGVATFALAWRRDSDRRAAAATA